MRREGVFLAFGGRGAGVVASRSRTRLLGGFSGRESGSAMGGRALGRGCRGIRRRGPGLGRRSGVGTIGALTRTRARARRRARYRSRSKSNYSVLRALIDPFGRGIFRGSGGFRPVVRGASERSGSTEHRARGGAPRARRRPTARVGARARRAPSPAEVSPTKTRTEHPERDTPTPARQGGEKAPGGSGRYLAPSGARRSP
jgi:hypothetical protein